MERRKRDRVEVNLQCKVAWPENPGLDVWTVTQNISRSGLLIWVGQENLTAPAIGRPVLLILERPGKTPIGRQSTVFRGQVVRVSRGADKSFTIAVKGSPVGSSHVKARQDLGDAAPALN